MRVLGIESSCDETAAAVVTERGEVLSDVVHSQVELHAPHGGIIPELASRDHMRNVPHVVREALDAAGVAARDLDGIAVTCRPGLVGALLVGVQVAKGMAWSTDVPLVGVDHLVGHLFAGFLARPGAPPPPPLELPFVALLASGGHTAIYRVDGDAPDAIVELGATRDDAAGEAFDKVAKLMGLAYPGGPLIDRLAREGDASRVPLTAPMRHSRSFEMSFSGLKTQVGALVDAGELSSGRVAIADLAASFQACVTELLTEKLVAAAKAERVGRVVIGGGVAANSELRARVAHAAAAAGLEALVPDRASCTDNAAMIAFVGARRLARGERDGFDLAAMSRTSLPRLTRKGRGARA